MRNLTRALALLLGLSLIFAACGGEDATPTPVRTTVNVALGEYLVSPDQDSAPSGDFTFSTRNGGLLGHEFIVLKTDLAHDALVVAGAEVDETASGEVMGKIEEDGLGPGQSESITLNLEPGKYVLFCNIPAHYQSGMSINFEVR